MVAPVRLVVKRTNDSVAAEEVLIAAAVVVLAMAARALAGLL